MMECKVGVVEEYWREKKGKGMRVSLRGWERGIMKGRESEQMKEGESEREGE